MESIKQTQEKMNPGVKAPGRVSSFGSKYGNVGVPVPEEMTSKAILEKLETDLSDGKITQNAYLKRKILAQGKVASLLWIAATNNMGKSLIPKLSGKPKRNRSR